MLTLMKSRPNKAKNGRITAGISRAGPGRSSAVGNGVDSSEEVRQPDSFHNEPLVPLKRHLGVPLPAFAMPIRLSRLDFPPFLVERSQKMLPKLCFTYTYAFAWCD